jgi:hypothetical protein
MFEHVYLLPEMAPARLDRISVDQARNRVNALPNNARGASVSQSRGVNLAIAHRQSLSSPK